MINKQSAKKIFIVMFFVLNIIPLSIFAQEVPANLQAALFKKIFSFNKTLQAKGVVVAVIGNSSDAIVSAFKEAGINVKAASGDQIPDGVTVVYVMSGTTPPKTQSAAKGVLSISGDASYVEGGKVAISIGTEDGKPKIIVHLAQLKAEGQELSPDLLKIARIIK